MVESTQNSFDKKWISSTYHMLTHITCWWIKRKNTFKSVETVGLIKDEIRNCIFNQIEIQIQPVNADT